MVPCNLVCLGSASGDIDRETLPPAEGAGNKTHVCKVFVQDRVLKKKEEEKKHEEEHKVSEAGGANITRRCERHESERRLPFDR